MQITELTLDNFADEVLFDEKVLVAFRSEGRSPMEAFSGKTLQNSGLKLCSVDIDAQQELATLLEVSHAPATIEFRNGRVVKHYKK